MASVSVYRSYVKCVLDTKTLILSTQDNGWLSVPPTELCYYQQQQQQQNFIKKNFIKKMKVKNTLHILHIKTLLINK